MAVRETFPRAASEWGLPPAPSFVRQNGDPSLFMQPSARDPERLPSVEGSGRMEDLTQAVTALPEKRLEINSWELLRHCYDESLRLRTRLETEAEPTSDATPVLEAHGWLLGEDLQCAKTMCGSVLLGVPLLSFLTVEKPDSDDTISSLKIVFTRYNISVDASAETQWQDNQGNAYNLGDLVLRALQMQSGSVKSYHISALGHVPVSALLRRPLAQLLTNIHQDPVLTCPTNYRPDFTTPARLSNPSLPLHLPTLTLFEKVFPDATCRPQHLLDLREDALTRVRTVSSGEKDSVVTAAATESSGAFDLRSSNDPLGDDFDGDWLLKRLNAKYTLPKASPLHFDWPDLRKSTAYGVSLRPESAGPDSGIGLLNGDQLSQQTALLGGTEEKSSHITTSHGVSTTFTVEVVTVGSAGSATRKLLSSLENLHKRLVSQQRNVIKTGSEIRDKGQSRASTALATPPRVNRAPLDPQSRHYVGSHRMSGGRVSSGSTRERKAAVLERPLLIDELRAAKLRPIIIVPSASTCLVNMDNFGSFMTHRVLPVTAQGGVAAERSPVSNACDIPLGLETRDGVKSDNSAMTTFKIMADSQVRTFRPIDWFRTVAVIVQGPLWQFDRWPFDDLKAFFTNVKGLLFVYESDPIPPAADKFAVEIFRMKRSTRHADITIWGDIVRHLGGILSKPREKHRFFRLLQPHMLSRENK